MSKISEHISYEEAVKHGKPNAQQLNAMFQVAQLLFEPIREWYGKPININSFFRDEAYNQSIGGAKGSQHCKGEAIDIDAGADNHLIWEWLVNNKSIIFDQIINEKPDAKGNPSWIHITYKQSGNRCEKLLFNGKNYTKL